MSNPPNTFYRVGVVDVVVREHFGRAQFAYLVDGEEILRSEGSYANPTKAGKAGTRALGRLVAAATQRDLDLY